MTIDIQSRKCHRIDDTIEVRIEKFPWRDIPPGCLGTYGDLSIRHREVFAREINNFDLFISQENDIKFTSLSLHNFVTTYQSFSRTGRGRPRPLLHMFERLDGQTYADWRLRLGKIYKVGAEVVFEPTHFGAGCCGYIAFRNDLITLMGSNVSAWCDPKEVKGEFNPAVSSWNSMLSHFDLVIRLPLSRQGSVDAGVGFHHMSNRLVKNAKTNSDLYTHPDFGLITWEEWAVIHSHCLPKPVNAKSLVATTVTVSGSECRSCIDRNKKVELKTSLRLEARGELTNHRRVDAVFSCEPS